MTVSQGTGSSLESTALLAPAFRPVTLISDFWPSELGEHELLLFQITKFAVVLYSSCGKLTRVSTSP